MPVDIVFGSPGLPQNVDHCQYDQELKDILTYAYTLVRKNLGTAAKRRKQTYDMNARIKHFAPGDKVWVFVPRKRREHYPKWEKYYTRPFVVIEQTGPLNFIVQKLPRGRSFVAHADKLLRCGSDEMDESLSPTQAISSSVIDEAINGYSLQLVYS